MYEYHDQYKRAHERGDVDAQARWARQLTWEIARHAVGEEIVVYPLMEKHLGDKGRQLADHDREEHLVCVARLYVRCQVDIVLHISKSSRTCINSSPSSQGARNTTSSSPK